MQQTNFSQMRPTQASFNLNLTKYRPTLVVWPGPPPSLGSNVPDKPTKSYPLQNGETVVTRRIGHHATVLVTKTSDPGSVLMEGPPSKNTDFYPSKSEIRLYPQGIDSPEYCRIEGSACAYTDGEGSHILRPNGCKQGPYPWHPRLSMRVSPTQPTRDFLQASQVSSSPYHIGLRYGPSGASVNLPADPPTVDPQCLTRVPTHKDSGYGGSTNDGSVCGSLLKDQTTNDYFKTGGPGETEPWGRSREKLDESFLLAGAQLGAHFGEMNIEEYMWTEDY